jgi:hypothetical protein
MRNKLLVIAVFIVIFVMSFLLWPEYSYSITCGQTSEPSGAGGCAAMINPDYSQQRIGGGLRWLRKTNFCIQPFCGSHYYQDVSEVQYWLDPSVAVLGSILIAGLAVSALVVGRRFSHQVQGRRLQPAVRAKSD